MEYVFSLFDGVRAACLRRTLKTSWARKTFSSRSQRTLALYGAAVALYLPLSLFFPIWILVIGPVLWGIPHIFASFRFIHYSIEKDKKADLNAVSFRFISIIWFLVTAYGVADELDLYNISIFSQIPFLAEIISMFATFCGLVIIYRFRWKEVLTSSLVFLPVAALSWLFPTWTVGVLLILHNWIAFIYWHQSAKTSGDRRIFFISLGIFALVHALIWLGIFDFLYKIYSPAGVLDWAGLDYTIIGKAITPWSENYTLWFHSVILYAFGQSIHYFVWMKAIPDLHLKFDVPTNYRQAWRNLKKDLGPQTSKILVFAVLIYPLIWVFMHYPEARAIYFAVAAYHGYMEISALGLSLVRSKSL